MGDEAPRFVSKGVLRFEITDGPLPVPPPLVIRAAVARAPKRLIRVLAGWLPPPVEGSGGVHRARRPSRGLASSDGLPTPPPGPYSPHHIVAVSSGFTAFGGWSINPLFRLSTIPT